MVNPVCSVDGSRVPCAGRSVADLDVMYLASVAETWLPVAVFGFAVALFAIGVVISMKLTGGDS